MTLYMAPKEFWSYYNSLAKYSEEERKEMGEGRNLYKHHINMLTHCSRHRVRILELPEEAIDFTVLSNFLQISGEKSDIAEMAYWMLQLLIERKVLLRHDAAKIIGNDNTPLPGEEHDIDLAWDLLAHLLMLYV